MKSSFKLVLASGTFFGLGLSMAVSIPANAQTAPMATPIPTMACQDGSGPNTGFFCAPRSQSQPIRACAQTRTGTALATCRKTTADSFCRTVAFGSAAAFEVDARGNLSEVTCSGRQVQTAAVTAPRTTPATTTPAQPASNNAVTPSQPSPQQDYVYATGHTTVDGSVTFKPTLQVSAFGPDMTGFTTITNPTADFDRFYQSGSGAYTAGRYTGTFANNVWRGTWAEDEDESGLSYVQTTCDRKLNGTLVWGQFEVRFTPDRRSFTGTKTLCDRQVAEANTWDKNSWKGTLTGRADATIAASSGALSTSTGSSSTGSRATSAQTGAGSTRPSQPRQETVADRVAREAAAAAEQRAKDEARQGVNRAIDNLIRRPR